MQKKILKHNKKTFCLITKIKTTINKFYKVWWQTANKLDTKLKSEFHIYIFGKMYDKHEPLAIGKWDNHTKNSHLIIFTFNNVSPFRSAFPCRLQRWIPGRCRVPASRRRRWTWSCSSPDQDPWRPRRRNWAGIHLLLNNSINLWFDIVCFSWYLVSILSFLCRKTRNRSNQTTETDLLFNVISKGFLGSANANNQLIFAF